MANYRARLRTAPFHGEGGSWVRPTVLNWRDFGQGDRKHRVTEQVAAMWAAIVRYGKALSGGERRRELQDIWESTPPVAHLEVGGFKCFLAEAVQSEHKRTRDERCAAHRKKHNTDGGCHAKASWAAFRSPKQPPVITLPDGTSGRTGNYEAMQEKTWQA